MFKFERSTVLLQTGELTEKGISIGTVQWCMYMQTLWCFEIFVIIVNIKLSDFQNVTPFSHGVLISLVNICRNYNRTCIPLHLMNEE